MRIKRVEIQNFRCLDHVVIDFDEVTTIIGPNGSGKSSILRALDWFFNETKNNALSSADVFSGAERKRIVVRVDFDQLSAEDREKLGQKYADDDTEILSIWRTWENGEDKMTGKAEAFPPFEKVRALKKATEQKKLYAEIASQHPDLTFGPWSNADVGRQSMEQFERDHPDLLDEADISATNLFGFAGQALLSGLFDFVLITADLRASEESEDNKTSVIGRILEKAVDRSVANAELAELNEHLKERHAAIIERNFEDQLATLSEELTNAVAPFAPGRSLEVGALEVEFKQQATKFRVGVDDHGTKTAVERQGHGFQRSLLVAALKLLAEREATSDSGVIYLAVEEPELFQHPSQAKTFAAVLRKLAQDASAGVQVGYATHSPYFVEPRYFDQIRRVHRNPKGSASPQVVVGHASLAKVVAAVTPHVKEQDVKNRVEMTCLNDLRDALFASAVLLVEGSTEQAIFEGLSAGDGPLMAQGIEVASAHGKPSLFLPHAVLKHLGIPVYVVFDNDAKAHERLLTKRTTEANGDAEALAEAQRLAKNQKLADAALNRKLTAFLQEVPQDWPTGEVGPSAFVFDDHLEAHIEEHWTEFATVNTQLVSAGQCAVGKQAASYRLTAKRATKPSSELVSIIERVKALV